MSCSLAFLIYMCKFQENKLAMLFGYETHHGALLCQWLFQIQQTKRLMKKYTIYGHASYAVFFGMLKQRYVRVNYVIVVISVIGLLSLYTHACWYKESIVNKNIHTLNALTPLWVNFTNDEYIVSLEYIATL